MHDDAALLGLGGEQILSSFVYDEGPDGRNYAVGVSAPLIAQQGQEGPTPPPLPGGKLNPYIQAANAYRSSDGQDVTGPRAGILDREV